MTSFIIKAHVDRKASRVWTEDADCSFCRIIQEGAPAVKVYEDDQVVAFLDILPLRKGHTLVVPKIHVSRLSDLPPDFAAATGIAVTKVAHALTEALGNTGLNVVCNQEYAQAVPHVHFHIIPAPVFGTPSKDVGSASESVAVAVSPLNDREVKRAEFQLREELDDNEAEEVAAKIRASL